MIITPAILPTLSLAPTAGRSGGAHMSDLYNDYYALKEPKRYDKSKPMDVLRVEAGLAFETALEQAMADKLGPLVGGERPGEFTTDCGIHYTPDLILFKPPPTRLGEIKCTWMSCRECPVSEAMAAQWPSANLPVTWDGLDASITFPPKFDKYFTQLKVYLFHLRMRHARLYIYFINGAYRPPTPVLLTWDFEFTEREITEEWLTMRNHGRTRKLIP